MNLEGRLKQLSEEETDINNRYASMERAKSKELKCVKSKRKNILTELHKQHPTVWRIYGTATPTHGSYMGFELGPYYCFATKIQAEVALQKIGRRQERSHHTIYYEVKEVPSSDILLDSFLQMNPKEIYVH